MQFAALHARSITTIDMNDNRLALSKQLGADHTYNRSQMSADEIVAAIRRATDGVSLAFMCIDQDLSDNRDAFDLAIAALRNEGRLTGLYVCVKEPNHRMNPQPLVLKEIKFAHMLTPLPIAYDRKAIVDTLGRACRLVADGRVQMKPLITHEVGLDGVEEAIKLCRHHPEEVIKVAVKLA
jgi:threonine dehydrogenase-like Zn-dependent dehydrogenase